MVIKPLRTSFVFVALVSQLSLTACAPFEQLGKWWGEAPEKPGVIQLPSTSAECADPLRIVEGDESESERTFECWVEQIDPLWSQVDGREKSSLTDQEIAILVRKGALSSSGDPEELLRKLYAAKKILGLGSPLTREGVNRWVSLLRAHRARIRTIYGTITSSTSTLDYAALRDASRISSEILEQMAWSMDSEQLVLTIRELITISNRDVRNALIPAARAGINLLNAVCPTFESKDVWAAPAIGACLVRAIDHFEMGAAWFNFAFDPEPSYSPEDIRSIRIALELLNQQFDGWFHQKQLSPIRTGLWIDLSRALGVDPPEDILSALELIQRFHKPSNHKEVDPTAFSGLFSLLRRAQMNVLDGLPHFARAFDEGRCLNTNARDWRECVPLGIEELRERSKVIDLAARLANPRYGTAADPFNGSRFARVMLYYTLSGRIIEAFDEDGNGKKDGLISAGAYRKENEVARLISIGLKGYETVRGFIDNIGRRWKSRPVEQISSERILDLTGLAELITMSHDVLVQRTPEDRNAIEQIVANLLNAFPNSAMFLDQASVAAVIVLADTLTSFRSHYLEVLPQRVVSDAGADRNTVSRATLAAALPGILERNFPRTFKSCSDFGFEASCGIAFDGIIPSASKDDQNVYVNDLDILTIAAAAMEGLLDTCDANSNEFLSWSSLNGNDELDCAYVRVKDILKRLIDADVIHASARDRVLAKMVLEGINSTFVTRTIGKVAMVRGTKRNLLLHWPLFWIYDDASIGSMFGLVSDVMDSSKAKRARKAAKAERKKRPKTG